MLFRATVIAVATVISMSPTYAQQPASQQAAPQQANPQQQPAQPSQQPQQQGQADDRKGGPRWQYQSEQSEARTYTQPGYAPSIPLEVEQLRNRVAALEDRAERLEKTLKTAVEVINAQTESIQKLSGN